VCKMSSATEMPGPDRVLPADNWSTSDLDGCVKIRSKKEWPANREPLSLPTFFKKQCESGGHQTALNVKRDGVWVKWSYEDYYKDVRDTAKAFVAMGLEPHNSVCIFGFNAPEWFFSDIGAIMAGGKAVGLYPTNSVDTNKFIINDSNCNILVVEDEKALEKMWTVRNELTLVRKIVVYTGKVSKDSYNEDVLTWAELIALGKAQSEEALNQRLENIAINQCSTLVYTSGTTGNPKGVMLSHDNIYWTTLVASDFIQMRESTEVLVSYLPLSHVAGNMVDIWCSIANKSTIYFADKMALKGSLVQTLQEARPTIFFGVPRVYEKIMEGMRAKAKDIKGLKKKVSQACKEAGLEFHLHGRKTLMYSVGQKVIYKKVREALGFDRCVTFMTGAAPIAKDVVHYFLSLDMKILELYGMSECTGPQSLCYYGNNYKMYSVGKIIPGAENRLSEPDAKGEGEVCMWGRHCMMGYLNRPDKTTEDMDEEGWIHSGDLGTVDKDGFLFITGRKKELLITAGGENVAPVPVEDNIKAELPCIANAILIGDRQKFLSVFLTFKVVMEDDTPTNKLTPPAIEWCQSQGRPDITTVEDILNGPDGKIMASIQAGIDRANKNAVSNASKVQRWTILPSDVSMPGGELGPTLKLKRFFFNKKYNDSIERLYV